MKKLIKNLFGTTLLLFTVPVMAGNDYKTLFNEGCADYARKDYAAAEKKLLLAQTAATDPAQGYMVSIRLANIYVAQKNFEAAIAEARKVIAYSKCGAKEKIAYRNLISDALYRLSKFAEAVQFADEALLLPDPAPQSSLRMTSHLLKAQNLLKLERAGEAMQTLQGAANEAFYPIAVQAKYNWLAGCAAMQLNDLKSAQSYFQKNLTIDGKWFTSDSRRQLSVLNNQLVQSKLPPEPNWLVDGSFEYANGGGWNRLMLNTHPYNSYLPGDCQWIVDNSTAFHGKKSLRSNGTKPLLLQAEGNPDNTEFSIYLKGQFGAEVKIQIFGYSRFQPTLLTEKQFKLSEKFKQYTVKIPRKWLSVDKEAATLEFYITPLNKNTVWADAAQWQKKAPVKFQDYKNNLFTADDAVKEFNMRRYPDSLTAPAKKSVSLPVKRDFTVKYPIAADNVPITVGIPFAPGEWFGDGSVTVESLADGKRYTAQGVISAYWVSDRSVRMLCVNFTAPVSGKIDKFKLHFSPAEPVKAPAYQPLKMSLLLTSGDGTQVAGKEMFRKVINSGAVFTDEVRQGLFCNATNAAWAMYTLHLRYFHKDKTVKINTNILNMTANAAALQEAALVIESGKSGTPGEYFQYYSHTNKRFALLPDGSCGKVSATGGTLLVREASLRHPVKLTVDKEGIFTGYLWSKDCKPLLLSRRMNLNREFIYIPAKVKADAYTYTASALPDVQEVVQSTFLMLPLGVINEKTHPFADKKFHELREKLLTPAENIFADQKKLIHGLFNYGDVYGDRGWSNQESYMDYSAFILALMRQDLDIFSNAQLRAVHYRDVDIIDGVASYHSPGHASGPSYEYSHSWPQGVMLHYLLTGDPRSYEVIKRVIDRYMATPVEYAHITDSRSLGRFLLGLSDFYALTGAPELKERFFVQLARAEKENLLPKFKDQTIFHWRGRCDPFHIWYGCFALYQMYKLTGEEKLLQSFKREMDASLNMDFFRHDLSELWYGVPQQEAWPIMLGYHSHHRGSLFYPMMRFYSEKFNRPDYLQIARVAAYAQFLRGDSHSEPMDIFRTSVLADAEEKSLLEKAIQLRRKAAPGQGKVVNGDFSASAKWFNNWHLPADRQMGNDDVMESWPLPEVKDIRKLSDKYKQLQHLVSPWRANARKYAYMDTREFYNAAPALRATSDGSVSLETAPIFIAPGFWKFTGAFKCDENVDLNMSNFTFSYTQEKENTRAYRIRPNRPDGPAELNVWHGTPILKNVAVRLIKGRKTSWREFEFIFRNEVPALITFKSYVRAKSGKLANMWFDDVKLERIK